MRRRRPVADSVDPRRATSLRRARWSFRDGSRRPMSLHRTIVPAEVDEDEEPVDPKIAIDEVLQVDRVLKAFVEYEACAGGLKKGPRVQRAVHGLPRVHRRLRTPLPIRACANFAARNFRAMARSPPPLTRHLAGSPATAPPAQGEPLAAGVRLFDGRARPPVDLRKTRLHHATTSRLESGGRAAARSRWRSSRRPTFLWLLLVAP